MKKLTLLVALIMSLCLCLATPSFGQVVESYRVGDRFYAKAYGKWSMKTTAAVGAGANSVTLTTNGVSDPNASCFLDTSGFGAKRVTPLFVGNSVSVLGDSNPETVTITASTTTTGACAITATFSYAHGAGAKIVSATDGLYEAIQDAHNSGGGVIGVDSRWGGTTAQMGAGLPYHNVSIEDVRGGPAQYWNVTQGATTALATPATLTAQAACDGTHTFCSDASAVGTWTSGTLYGCISYVDAMGNEGTCSATANFTSVVSKAIDVGAPAASTGAVGYTIYLSLVGGTYAFAYKVPITSSICTMTTIETVTAACAVANTLYGQTGSAAQIAGVTVNTAMLAPLASTTSSTTDYVPNPNARTIYAYVPGSRVGIPGVLSASLPFPVAAAAATTVPEVIGTLALPAGFMNFVGKTIEVCGYATQAANGSASTITTMQLWWDAAGSNAAGVPVMIGTIAMTNTLVTTKADQYNFCMDLKTTVAGATATSGTILQTGGFFSEQYVSSSVATVPVTTLNQGGAAVGSLNLAGEARIDVVYLHTTATDANGLVLQDLTVKVLN